MEKKISICFNVMKSVYISLFNGFEKQHSQGFVSSTARVAFTSLYITQFLKSKFLLLFADTCFVQFLVTKIY